MRARRTTILLALALAAPTAAAGAFIPGTTRADRIAGTAKVDRVDVLYGGTDRVTCGRGVDVVTADPADRIAPDCELVTRRISVDTLLGTQGQHQTEVEPSVAAWGATAVATFQVARFRDGGAAGIGWASSTNAGRTWRSGILPGVTTASAPAGDAPRASDPVAAYDAAHGTWLVSSLVLGNDYSALGISRSPDGARWATPVFASRTANGSLAYDKEWIACDNTPASPYYGSCYLAYTDIAVSRIAVLTSKDGGATWGAPVTVTSAFGVDAVGALPLVQPDGALTVVLLGAQRGMYAVQSRDGGATFAPPVGIAPLTQDQQPLLRALSLPAATVDASGRLYVAWADCRFRRGCDGNTVVLASSADGTTWSTPTRVPGAGFDSLVPAIAADPAVPGRLGLVTYVRTSSSSCSAAACSLGVAMTSSRNGGRDLDEAAADRREAGALRVARLDGGRPVRRRLHRRGLRRRPLRSGLRVRLAAAHGRTAARGDAVRILPLIYGVVPLLIRLGIAWAINLAALWVADALWDGVTINGWAAFLIGSAVLGIANTLIKPIARAPHAPADPRDARPLLPPDQHRDGRAGGMDRAGLLDRRLLELRRSGVRGLGGQLDRRHVVLERAGVRA